MGLFLGFAKITGSLAYLVVLNILSKFDNNNDKADVERKVKMQFGPDGLIALRVLIATSYLYALLAACILYFYPIRRKQHAEILEATEARFRGAWRTDPLKTDGRLLPPYEHAQFLNMQ